MRLLKILLSVINWDFVININRMVIYIYIYKDGCIIFFPHKITGKDKKK